MKRREFISLLGGATTSALLAPGVARAVESAIPTIGFVNPASPDGLADRVRSFRQGLKETGYVEGENVAIEYRWADNQLERLPALVADLVRRQVAVIAAPGGPVPALAAKAATTAIPIVFVVAEDPVKYGLVASLARPGGNLTGVNVFTGELAAKRLELLRMPLPSAARIAVLVHPGMGAITESTLSDVEAAAHSTGLQVQFFTASTAQEIDEAFASLTRERPDALFVGISTFFTDRRVQFALASMLHRIPATYPWRDFVDAGGLMSYGASLRDAYRQAGVYAGRILKGAKPADLPVVQASKLELAINHQTARMLGLVLPPSLLALADEVIE